MDRGFSCGLRCVVSEAVYRLTMVSPPRPPSPVEVQLQSGKGDFFRVDGLLPRSVGRSVGPPPLAPLLPPAGAQKGGRMGQRTHTR